MSCIDCAGLSMPVCGGPAILICVRSATDPYPIPAWVTAVCEAGELVSVGMFSDEAATIPLVGYTLANRVTCPESLLGSTCETAQNTNLCPATLAILEARTEAQTAALQATMNANSAAEIVALQDIEQSIDELIAITQANPNYAHAFTYTANGDVETDTRTTVVAGFPVCEVQTYSYNGAFQLTGISAWVPCP